MLTASFFATSVIAVESEQAPPAPTEPARAASKPAAAASEPAAKAKSKPTAKHANEAAKQKPQAAAKPKPAELSRKAYARLLAAEVRKHSPKSTESGAGSVTVAFTIGASGRVVSHKIQQASDPALAEVADKILASIHTPPPPDGAFSAVQQFNFH
jgi:hypothetical protein